MYNKGDWWVEVFDNYTTVESRWQTICSDVSNCDAHLIAASPKMYEALKDIKKYVTGLDAMGPETGQVIAGKCYLALSKAENENQ